MRYLSSDRGKPEQWKEFVRVFRVASDALLNILAFGDSFEAVVQYVIKVAAHIIITGAVMLPDSEG